MPNPQEININHYIVQAWGINFDLLNGKQKFLKTATKMAGNLNLTILNTFIHKFDPHGLSLIFVISQSHIAIHTWPEFGYLHLDILTCSEDSDLGKLPEVFQKAFNPQKFECKKISY